jgi:GGDEF domain-containing protein
VQTTVEAIVQHPRAPFVIDGHTNEATTSDGTAVRPQDDEDRDVLKGTDVATYTANKTRREKYRR